jgi:ribosomal protein L37E
MPKKFTRTIEDFVCEHCGEKVVGNGYTNHCSKCLWSKHVDRNPGDRLEVCQGLMAPAQALKKNGEIYIMHQCARCGFERNNKFGAEDNFDALLKIQK